MSWWDIRIYRIRSRVSGYEGLVNHEIIEADTAEEALRNMERKPYDWQYVVMDKREER